MSSPTKENYLKSLLTLTNKKGEVSMTELSNSLNLSLPSVNSMMKTLMKQGFVNYEKYKPVTLTEKGHKEAAIVLRRHRLTEMYLVNKMGFGWEDVHEIAEQLEHIHSTIFFDRMDKLLDFPKYDPHGSPIPDKNGNLHYKNYNLLSSCKPGETVRLIALSNDSKDFLNLLNRLELKLGTEIEIKSVEDFDGSTEISYKNHQYVNLSQIVCECIYIETVASE
jgi:DtxR family transcriptional regulator, Mn-dependent transcriptional regulator